MTGSILFSGCILALVAVSGAEPWNCADPEHGVCYENKGGDDASRVCRYLSNIHHNDCPSCSDQFLDDYQTNNCGRAEGLFHTRLTCGERQTDGLCKETYDRSAKDCFDLAHFGLCAYEEQIAFCDNSRPYRIYYLTQKMLELNAWEDVQCRRERIDVIREALGLH
ncbi:unnamed protein product, partial [Mesorhabditis spiculigera]